MMNRWSTVGNNTNDDHDQQRAQTELNPPGNFHPKHVQGERNQEQHSRNYRKHGAINACNSNHVFGTHHGNNGLTGGNAEVEKVSGNTSPRIAH